MHRISVLSYLQNNNVYKRCDFYTNKLLKCELCLFLQIWLPRLIQAVFSSIADVKLYSVMRRIENPNVAKWVVCGNMLKLSSLPLLHVMAVLTNRILFTLPLGSVTFLGQT